MGHGPWLVALSGSQWNTRRDAMEALKVYLEPRRENLCWIDPFIDACMLSAIEVADGAR